MIRMLLIMCPVNSYNTSHTGCLDIISVFCFSRYVWYFIIRPQGAETGSLLCACVAYGSCGCVCRPARSFKWPDLYFS